MIDKSNALVARSDVHPEKDYHQYQEALRWDFWYACAYCAMTEIEATGIGFQIDHYHAKEKFPKLECDYNNLMWSCQKCNRYKSDYCPDVEDVKKGYVIIKIDECDPREHLDYEPGGIRLKPKTKTGEFNIEKLELNRQQLRRVREYRQRLWDASEYIAFGIHHLLTLDLDGIHPKYRVRFQRLKEYVGERGKEVSGSMKLLIKEFAHSELLDKDPEKGERQKKRKKYLREIKAIVPE